MSANKEINEIEEKFQGELRRKGPYYYSSVISYKSLVHLKRKALLKKKLVTITKKVSRH